MSEGKNDAFSFSVNNQNRSTSGNVVAGVVLAAMWGAIGTLVTQMAIHGNVNGFLVFLLVLVGGCVTATAL